jgi:hypothetical protein
MEESLEEEVIEHLSLLSVGVEGESVES